MGVHDDRLLKYVKDIQGSTADNGDQTVRMLFWENPYFSNEELVRTMCSDGSSEGTVIEWKGTQFNLYAWCLQPHGIAMQGMYEFQLS